MRKPSQMKIDPERAALGLEERTRWGCSAGPVRSGEYRRLLGRISPCCRVSSVCRRRNVGGLSESEGIGPTAGNGDRHLQADLVPPAGIEPATPSFGNHAEGVACDASPCAIVLHGPRFCRRSVLVRVQARWAVATCHVGSASAARPHAVLSGTTAKSHRPQPKSWGTRHRSGR